MTGDSEFSPIFASSCPKCRGAAILEAVENSKYDIVCLSCGARMQPVETLSLVKKRPVIQLKELETFLRQKLEANFRMLKKGMAGAASVPACVRCL